MIIKKDQVQLLQCFRTTFSDPEKALSLFQTIPKNSPSFKSHIFNSDAQYVLYRIYLRKGEYQKAKEIAENNLASLFHAEDKHRLFYLLLACCSINLLLNNSDIAYQFALNARDVVTNLNDVVASVKFEFLFGRIFLARNQYQDAREHFLKAIEIMSSYSDDKERGDILLNICGCYMHEGNWAQSILYGLQVIEAKERYILHTENTLGEETYGWLVYGCGQYMRIPVSDNAVLADGYYDVGVSYENLGDYSQAIEYLLKAIGIKENIRDMLGVANCANALGMLYRSKKEYSKALDYFKRSSIIFSEQSNALLRGYALVNIAEIKAVEGDAQTSLTLGSEAEVIFSEYNDNYGKVSASVNLAGFLRRAGRYTEAIDKLNLTLVYASGINAKLHQISCYYERGLCYHELRNAKLARESLLQALALAEAQDIKKELISIHEALCNHYQSIKQFKDALHHQQQVEKIRQQLFNEESDRREKNLTILYEVEKHKRASEESKQALLQSQAEVEAKTRELADFALRIVEKQEFLDTIEKGLESILQAKPAEKDSVAMNLLRSVRRDSTVDEDWQAFQTQFNGMQQDFVNAVTRSFPSLSPTELKVCALLRMNLRTKEIADIMHISSKAVENHRLRLRKKMGLGRDANLVKALLEMGSV